MSTEANFKRAARAVREFRKEMRKRVIRDGLVQIGEEIKTDVAASRPGKGIPRDFGVLASTLRVRAPGAHRVFLTAGGAAAAYALVQHEKLDLQHDIGEARYLVRGIERWKPDGSAAMEAMKDQSEEAAKRVARGPNGGSR